MAHFYGSITGQAGPATRVGSKRSGYRAWAQNGTGRVTVYLWHNGSDDTDLAEIALDASTRNYGGNHRLALGPPLDLAALIRHADDPEVRKHIERASESLTAANQRARALSSRPIST